MGTNEILEYKGYNGSVEYSDKDDILFGKVLGINSLISYEGSSVGELKTDFEEAVDDYLEICQMQNIGPEKQYKGCINVRIDPEIHKKAVVMAQSEHMSLNQFIELSVKDKLQSIS